MWMLIACGGGGLVAEAESAADKACACADKDCAKEAVAAFNKRSYKAKDEKEALDDAAKTKLKVAVDRMSACRDNL
jgi:hypothetical protein